MVMFLLTACSASDDTDVITIPLDSEQPEQPSDEIPSDEVADDSDTEDLVPEEQPKIECLDDSDCGERRIENAYCFQGFPTGDIYDWKCENAGMPEAKCKQVAKQGVFDECDGDEFCRDGQCVEFANCTDTDGGKNYEERGKVMTNDLAVHEDNCEDDNTLLEYYCSENDMALSEIHNCECSRDACVLDEEEE